MGSRLGFFLVALVVSSVLAAEPDEIAWIPTDGASGWRTAVPSGPPPTGAVVTPLLAPTWFAKLPNATVALAPSGSFELAAARGKVLLLDYWASWCGPCLKELPHLQRLHATRGADGLVALAVNADEDAATASDSAKRLGLTMMIGLNDPALHQTLGIRTLPSLFAIDKQGRMRSRWDGYRVGVENEIAATIDKLLADDTTGTTREMAAVLTGQGRLRVRWSRDLPGSAAGVVGLPAGAAVGAARVVASGGDELLSFDADGEIVARVKTRTPAGRLLDFGTAADDSRELVGFRPGGTAIDVIALRSGEERTIAAPAPIIDVVVLSDSAGSGRRIAMSTLGGAATASATDDRATLVGGAAGVRSVVGSPGHGVLALNENGSIAGLLPTTPAWPHPALHAERLLAARDNGAIAAPRSVTVAVSGRFLPEGGRQLAVATFAGRLAILDESSGKVLFDAAWTGVHDLAAIDLDGDGRDELLVASGRFVTVLGAAAN